MWKSRIAALLVVIAALVTVDLVVRLATPAEAREQVVRLDDRYVSVSSADGNIFRMTESGVVEYYDWSGGMAGRGFVFQEWTVLP